MYQVIMADPPWRFGDTLPGETRGAARHYSTMTIQQLCEYELPPIADRAALFLWKVAAIPGWLEVCRAWGFEPVSEVVWVKLGKVWRLEECIGDVGVVTLPDLQSAKLAFGMGRTVRNSHEVMVIARRGRPMSVDDKSIRSVFFAPVREHSRKPDEAYWVAERLYPGAKRCELFSRESRPGWDSFGLEVGKFNEEEVCDG